MKNLLFISVIIILISCSKQAGPSKPQLVVGDTLQGGIIGYILTSNDSGYSTTTQHGIIVAPTDFGQVQFLVNFTIPAPPNGSGIYGQGIEDKIGSGKRNTNYLIKNSGGFPGTYAALLCANYNGGGFNDWFLPSAGDLIAMYSNQKSIGGFTTLGTGSFYWSSTLNMTNNVVYNSAYVKNFANGDYFFDVFNRGVGGMATLHSARAIRYF